MGRDKFRFKINVEPKDIPSLDDSHKRDCADVMTGIINSVFKYTLIFCLGGLAFFGAYSLFSFTYFLRIGEVLPQFPVILPVLFIFAAALEFVSGTMQKWAVIAEILLNAAVGFVAVTTLQTLIILPFAVYAVAVHFKLLTLIPVYKVLSAQPGFPEFTPLPSKETHIQNNFTEKSE